MFQKIKNISEYRAYIDNLRDVRVSGLLIFGFVVLLVSWSGVKAIETNYQLQREISELQQKNAVEDLRNENIRLQNQYYKSDQFLELSARQNFGLAKPGETEVIIPKDVALSYTLDLGEESAEKPKAANKQPAYQRNFQAWVNFFMHRTTVIDN